VKSLGVGVSLHSPKQMMWSGPSLQTTTRTVTACSDGCQFSLSRHAMNCLRHAFGDIMHLDILWQSCTYCLILVQFSYLSCVIVQFWLRPI
jgi:hypothetical protein